MAKQKLKAKDILDWDVAKYRSLNKEQLHEALKTLTAVANRRIRALRKAGLSDTPALDKLGNRKHFYARQKNYNAMRSEFARVRKFLQSKTSTVSGYKKMIKDINKGLKKHKVTVADSTKTAYNRTPERQMQVNHEHLWRAYEELKTRKPEISERLYKYAVLDRINKVINEKPGYTVEKIAEKVYKELDAIYEEEIRTIERVNDVFTPVDTI